MKLSVNARTVAVPAQNEATLDALMDGLRSSGEIERDQVVVELRVDGRAWQADDVDTLYLTSLRDVREVVIRTDDLRGCARRILTDAGSMMGVLREGAVDLAAQFRSGDAQEANTGLFNLLNALQQFLVCLYRVRNTCALDATLLGSTDELAAVGESLDAILAAQERKDWHGLASCLEKDLVRALDGLDGTRWRMIGVL